MNTLITEFVVTEMCNLDCDYCYMKDCNTYMSLNGVHDFIRNVGKVMDIYNTKQYHISYFGGEPLLNWPVIKQAIPLFKNDPRCESQVIISNGLLINEDIVNTCLSNNIGMSWSFDGMWQNTNRPHKTLRDTIFLYKDRWPLIKQLSNGCKVMVGPGNIDTMVDNLEFFINEFGIYNPDYSLVRDDIWSPDDVKRFEVESKRLADQVIMYFKSGMNVSVGFYNLALMDVLNGELRAKRPFGCFAGCHGVGYFPNGDWYPCARFGSERTFRIMDGKGVIYRDNIDTLLNKKVSDPRTYQECIACNMYKYCNAGCTFSQLKHVNKEYIAGPVKSICDLYKIIYSDTLRIYDELKNLKNYRAYLDSMTKQLGVGKCI